MESEPDIPSKKLDWSHVPDDAIPELLRLAETCLAGTVTSGIAADHRATASSGIFGAGAIALLVAAAANASTTSPGQAFLIAAVTGALLLLLASILAAHAGRPIDFFFPGYEPKLLLSTTLDLKWLQRFTVNDIQMRIDANRKSLEASAKILRLAHYAALAAVAISVCVFFLAIPPR